MSPQNPFDDPKLVRELAHTFESVWLVMRAHEPLVDADRAKELSIEISRKLVALAADGVTDPAQLRRLTWRVCIDVPATYLRNDLDTFLVPLWPRAPGRRHSPTAVWHNRSPGP
jgi:hypothetical protein